MYNKLFLESIILKKNIQYFIEYQDACQKTRFVCFFKIIYLSFNSL